ncbi:MAG TPA: exonuclease subunit SbcD [Treponema sp.]|nr:exonuclease subunit SbcD [Treponema sp.]
MKILHTGDLHLGKILHETSLLEDQKMMLDRLIEELFREPYVALILAGDIYDRTIPPAEAVELFSIFLVQVRTNFPDLVVFIISGNHDSARRLSFVNKILGQQHIHIIGDPEESFTPIITVKDGKRLAFFLLPFLLPGSLEPLNTSEDIKKPPATTIPPELDFSIEEKDEKLLRSQADLAKEASERFDSILSQEEYQDIPTILVTHLFMTGGEESSSERVFIGTAERVATNLFSKFTYVALGHLHKRQRVHDRIWYAGAPLAYAFDEAGAEKSFLRVTIDTEKTGFPITVEPVPVHPLRPVVRLSGSFDDFYTSSQFEEHAGSYLEITLNDKTLVANPMNLLRPKFPFLLSIRQGIPLDSESEATAINTAPEKGSNPIEDFCSFQQHLYGSIDEQKKELFVQLLGDLKNET